MLETTGKILYSVDQAAEYLGIAPRTVRAFASREAGESSHLQRVGEDSPYYLGETIIIFEHDELERFKNRQRLHGRPAGAIDKKPRKQQEDTIQRQQSDLESALQVVYTEEKFTLRYENGNKGRGWYLRFGRGEKYYFEDRSAVVAWLMQLTLSVDQQEKMSAILHGG